MKNNLHFPHYLFIAGLAIMFSFAASASPAFAQCDKTTDAQLVTNIYAKIKADKGLAGQISHINVVSISAAIKFQGWADSKSDYDKITDFAINESCVRLVNVNAFSETPPAAGNQNRASNGCGPGTKACGDVCIPEGDPCNITGAKAGVAELFIMPMPRGLGFLSISAGCN